MEASQFSSGTAAEGCETARAGAVDTEAEDATSLEAVTEQLEGTSLCTIVICGV